MLFQDWFNVHLSSEDNAEDGILIVSIDLKLLALKELQVIGKCVRVYDHGWRNVKIIKVLVLNSSLMSSCSWVLVPQWIQDDFNKSGTGHQ